MGPPEVVLLLKKSHLTALLTALCHIRVCGGRETISLRFRSKWTCAMAETSSLVPWINKQSIRFYLLAVHWDENALVVVKRWLNKELYM
jgi:hypothetical protein